jgi:hypothetical protein
VKFLSALADFSEAAGSPALIGMRTVRIGKYSAQNVTQLALGMFSGR